MPAAEAADYRFNPFDLTKVWPHEDYPPIESAGWSSNRNPENVFAEVEQSIFSPAQLRARHRPVPGQDAPGPPVRLRRRAPLPPRRQRRPSAGERARRRPRRAQLRPRRLHATTAGTRGAKNYEPNSFGGPAQTGRAAVGARSRSPATTGTHEAPAHAEDDDFVQAGKLYRLMSEDEKSRLIDNIAGGLSQVSRDDVIEKNLAHFHAADADYGKRVEEAVRALRED